MKIGVLLVSTGRYHIFLQPLIDGIEKHFFKDHKVEMYLFTDRVNELKHSDRINITQIATEHKPFPYPTQHRYHFFTSAYEIIKCDYLFYMDVDMGIVADVGEEILGDLVAVLHPGFYRGGGSWETRPESKSYIPPEKRIKYYAGGVQGGRAETYLSACSEMAAAISDDENRGISPVWNDESSWNEYLTRHDHKTLTPEYCMVEEDSLQRRWGIADLPKKIIALKKDHAALRS